MEKNADIFNLDISSKNTKIACNTFTKFLPPSHWKFYLQKPKTIKDLQIFSFANETPEENKKQLESLKTSLKSGHIITRKNNSICRNNKTLKSNVLFHEIVGAEAAPPLVEARNKENTHIHVGNFIIFYDNTLKDNLDELKASRGVVLGFSICTKNLIKHAHLCKFVPPGKSYLCSGTFMIDLKQRKLLCRPRSGSWALVKKAYFAKNYKVDSDTLDDINSHIASLTIQKYLKPKLKICSTLEEFNFSKL
jgi:hypothetical protein